MKSITRDKTPARRVAKLVYEVTRKNGKKTRHVWSYKQLLAARATAAGTGTKIVRKGAP